MSGREHYVHTGFTLVVPSANGQPMNLTPFVTSLKVVAQSAQSLSLLTPEASLDCR